MQPIRWGVIGVGRFGMIHAAALSSLPQVDLVALCTRNTARLKEAATAFDVRKTYNDFRRLLDDADVEAVSITTHWRDHCEIALAALAAGKHVLLEKPMAADRGECRQLLEAAAAAKGYLLVGHVCRFDPRITLAKEAIDAGRLGRIVSMHARRNLPKAPGSLRLDKISPLMGDGIHDADLMMWFLGGPPTRVYGRTIRVDQFTYPDVGWAMLEFGEEAVGVVETVWRLPENTPTVIDAVMEVIGTEGKLTIDCAHTGLEILDSEGLKRPDTAYWPTQHGRQVGALSNEIRYFTDCIRTGTPPAVITPAEAARAVAVMQSAEESAAQGQPIVVRL